RHFLELHVGLVDRAGNETHLTTVVCDLCDLKAARAEAADEGPGMDRGPNRDIAAEDEGHALAAEHLLEHRKGDHAGAVGASSRDVGQRIANERHGIIVKRRDHDASAPAGGDGAIVVADHLDAYCLSLDVEAAAMRARGGDEAALDAG